MATGFRASLLAGAAAVLLSGGVARADVTAAQAGQVESQIRTWMTGMLGPRFPLSDRPIQLTPAGDHFDAVVMVRPKDASGSEIRITATARPLDGGKWSIDGIKTAMPLQFAMEMPAPPVDGKPAVPPTMNVKYTVDLVGQEAQILFDPSLDTPSTTTSSIKGMTVRMVGGPMDSVSTMGASNSVTTLKPAGGNRLDVSIDGTLQDYRIATGTAEKGPLEIAMKLVRVNGGLDGINRERATLLVQSYANAMAVVFAPQPGQDAEKAMPEVAKQIVAALQDFASEFSLDESIEGLEVKASGMAAVLAKVKFGLGAKSDQGMLQARMELGAEGLKLPGLNLGPLAELIPSEVAFRPFVSGVGVAELTRIIQSAGDKKDPAPADIAALFSHGGIVTGLESMSMEVGGATFTGQGKVTFVNPQQFSGGGQITAEDFDELMEKVNGVPMAAQAVPVLTLAKGLAKSVGNKLVWNITYDGGKLLVNNVDVLKMAGGGGAPPPRSRGPATGRFTPNRN